MKGPRTYLVRCGDQIRFVHGDHLKIACCIQSSSSWEGEEDSNYARNLLSSLAAVQSGAWSPSEPLVSTSEAEGNLDAGDVEEQETTELIPERSLEDALDGQVHQGHHCQCTQHLSNGCVPESVEETTTQTHM